MFDIKLGNFIPAIIFFVIVIGIRLYFRKYKNDDKVLVYLKAIIISFLLLGVFFIIYGFLLPKYSSLSTFGYPETVENIDTDEELLKYLQRYNDAISQISRVLSTTFFILMIVFFNVGSYVYEIFKELRKTRK